MTAKPPNEHNHRLYIETVGCQMNMLDSELVVGALGKFGYTLTDDAKQADTILLNTCSVREHAEHKIYSQLGRLKHIHRQRPNVVVGVMGCMAQKDQKLIFKRAPHVDLVVGTGQLAEIPRLIEEARHDRKRKLAVSLGRRDGSVQAVSTSCAEQDLSSIAMSAHSLKSACANMGAHGLSDHCKQLELSARQGHEQLALSLAQAIHSLFSEVQTALQGLRRQHFKA